MEKPPCSKRPLTGSSSALKQMSSWQELVAGAVEETSQETFWTGLVWVMLLGTIVGVLLFTRGRTAKPNMPAKVLYESMEADPTATVLSDSGRAEPTGVKAKHAGNSLWASVDDGSDYPVPETDTFSYSKFQQALLSGVERQVDDAPVMKMHSSKDLDSWNQQLMPLREMLTRQNKTIEQFMEENNIALPEDVIEMWSAVKHMKPSHTSFNAELPSLVNAEEAAGLMKDAIQNIPTVNVDYASAILREVLSARSEASTLGLTLPSLSQEQMRTLEFWKVSGQNPAADLASKILSRA